MRTITICQPFAELIMTGAKRVENRRWSTSYRGPLAIHAGRSQVWLEKCPDLVPKGRELTFGAIVGVVELEAIVHVREIESYAAMFETYGWLRPHVHVTGPLCWILANPRRLIKPVVWRGQQGLYDVPDRVIEKALAA